MVDDDSIESISKPIKTKTRVAMKLKNPKLMTETLIFEFLLNLFKLFKLYIMVCIKY